VGTREGRKDRGRRRGEELLRRLIGELRTARQAVGVSQEAVARELGCAQSEVSRLERFEFGTVSLVRLSEIASLLGLEISAGLHPLGDALRDAGQERAVGRFVKDVAAPPYRVFRETLLPLPGDRRAWDLLLRLGALRIGVEVETRVRDIQALVRRIRERERDGGVDEILVVLSDSAHNRRVVGQLREALGPRYSTRSGPIFAALRAGAAVPGRASSSSERTLGSGATRGADHGAWS
jgi:transcriptional regulator with XRE-family HTH domain